MRTLGAWTLTLFLVACGTKNTSSQSTPAAPVGPAAPAEPSVDPPPPDQTGEALAQSLLAQWQRQHPDRDWEAEVRLAHPDIPPPADNSDVVGVEKGQGEGQTYGRYAQHEVATWQRETERFVLEGARVFHSGDALGSTVGVSCDMCHPDAANTHPETYPKFQTQTGRVILLRDMINWCLINPVRAEPWTPDDPRMRAVEAYILAQRKGTPLDYGKH